LFLWSSFLLLEKKAFLVIEQHSPGEIRKLMDDLVADSFSRLGLDEIELPVM